MKTLSKNCQFVLTASIFIILWGTYITFGNVLTPLFEGIFTSSQTSIIGGIFVIAGVLGSYLMGFFLDKT